MTNKILITGACGFIGSHLTELCIKKGYNVVAFDRYNSFNSYGWLENSNYLKDIEFVLGDIRDYDSVYKASKGCDSIFHLAALIGIPYSYISPLAYIRTNVEGTYNILEASKNLNISETIITSTSETYGSAEFTPMSEDHRLIGQSPYSASKIAADQLSISYIKSFNLPIKIVRPFNTYGPRQSERAIIPSIINQIIKGNNKIMLGNTSPTRDLTHVLDTCEAFISIFKCKELLGEITNIGSSKEISIKELVALIAKIMNLKINIQSSDERIRPDKSEVTRLLCDNNKLISNTDWKIKFNLEKGLKDTINWFKDNQNYKSKEFNKYHV